MPTAEKQREADLLDAPPSQALVPTDPVALIAQLAASKDVDVDKLRQLIDMQERILKHNAKAEFDAAYSQMQPEIPEIDERGQILVKGQLRSRYAKLEDIQAVTKPILKTYGFAMRHRTEWPAEKPGIIRIVGILTHRTGHAEESVFEAKADASDYRTDIQSQGSTVSYGRRYTTIDLLNITTRGLDNDGQNQARPEVKAPQGFEAWWDDMQAVADEGTAKLEAAWKASSVAFRNHLMATNKQGWEQVKRKAAQVKS